jgi:hypothetical protein
MCNKITDQEMLAEVQESLAEMIILFEELAAHQRRLAPRRTRLELLNRIVHSMHRVNGATNSMATHVLESCAPFVDSPFPPEPSTPSPSSPLGPCASLSCTLHTSGETKKPGLPNLESQSSPISPATGQSEPGAN